MKKQGRMPGRGWTVLTRLLLAIHSLLQAACATGLPLDVEALAPHAVSTEKARVVPRGEHAGPAANSKPRPRTQRTSPRADGSDLPGTRDSVGWPDGVGNGRPFATPMSLDYFQGFLLQAGVPAAALPLDGRTLSPAQALALLPHLVATPVTLGLYGPRRMAAHLLLEVATGGVLVSQEELHTRMRRFARLRVVRPDGYLVKPTTGEAVQKVGAGVLAEDGTLRAGRFEVGPFYAIDGGRLFAVDRRLEVSPGALPVGLYVPDDGVLLPAAEGAVLAVVDTVEGLLRLVFDTQETLEGLAQLPGVVRELYAHAPEHWEAFRHKPQAERVRALSRLVTGAVLLVGSAGAGAAKAASWGGTLGPLGLPVLSLSEDGLLAVQWVAVPVGGAVAVGGQALSGASVLHMAVVGAQGAAGGGWPPIGGPGQWVEDTSSMSPQARDYQAQVTGAPKGWCYRVCRDGECVEYDGFDSQADTLLETKALGYDQWFLPNLAPRFDFKGLAALRNQARRQSRTAGGMRVRWYVAEPRMVAILKRLFQDWNVTGIEVIHKDPLP